MLITASGRFFFLLLHISPPPSNVALELHTLTRIFFIYLCIQQSNLLFGAFLSKPLLPSLRGGPTLEAFIPPHVRATVSGALCVCVLVGKVVLGG